MEHVLALILMATSGDPALAGAAPGHHQVPPCIRLEASSGAHRTTHARCVAAPARATPEIRHHPAPRHAHDDAHRASRAASRNTAPRYVSPHGRQPAPPLRDRARFERAQVRLGESYASRTSQPQAGCCDCACDRDRLSARAEARAVLTLDASGFTGGVGRQPGFVVVYPHRTRVIDPRFNPPSAGRAIQRVTRSSGSASH